MPAEALRIRSGGRRWQPPWHLRRHPPGPERGRRVTLPPGGTLIRWLATDDLPDAVWHRWHALLDAEERARAERFVHAADRLQFIAAHALLRLLLTACAGYPMEHPPGAWRFATGPFGRPALHPDHALPDLDFNISHTSGAIACALSRAGEIGVDIEDCARAVSHIELARAYFAPAETAELEARAGAARARRFTELWTLKEATIKAIGLGLSMPLDAVSFTGVPPQASFADASEEARLWQFHCQAAGERHVLAVALRRAGGPPVALVPDRASADAMRIGEGERA
jgi:4'-phosphopantetheinyl transferase